LNQRWYNRLDWSLLVVWGLLVGIGLLAIYSATHGPASEYLLLSVQQNFERQLTWAIISLIAMAVVLLFPVKFYQAIALPAYGVTLLLLVIALFLGREINGAKSWLYIGPVGIQVSELAKLGALLALAQLFGSLRDSANYLKTGALASLLLLAPAILIVLQNDAGTALVFLALIPIILFWSGIPLLVISMILAPVLAGYLAIVYIPAAIIFVLLFSLLVFLTTRSKPIAGTAFGVLTATCVLIKVALTNILQPHQVARIASFVDPEAYRFTSGFHIIQARAAVGSGGIYGKGFRNGMQTQMAFVPEQTTDFIYCVIGEEFGFIGSLVLIALFAFLIIRITLIIGVSRHAFSAMTAAGAAGIFLIHVLINIGMAITLLPVIGIPLPFVSYGGSSLLFNSVLLALVINFHMRRNEFPRFSPTVKGGKII